MMKSDISQTMCLALTSFFFLACVVSLTEGKCKGNWAIHACWGGNGKRSDPGMDDGSNPSLLRQLLLRNSPVFTPPAFEVSVDELAPVERDELVSPFNSEFPEYPVPTPSRKVNRLTALLRTLRTLQKESNSLP